MGIKDNFSQAVKELWKKEGQDKKDDNKQPSELDRYLRGDSGGQGNAVSSGVDVNSEGVPLETPYYRSAADNDNTSTGQQTQKAETVGQEQPSQSAQPTQSVQASEQPNRNVQNAQSRPEPQNNAGAQRSNPNFGADERPQYNGDQPPIIRTCRTRVRISGKIRRTARVTSAADMMIGEALAIRAVTVIKEAMAATAAVSAAATLR